MVFTKLFVHLLGCQSRSSFISESGSVWYTITPQALLWSQASNAVALFKQARHVEHKCFPPP